MKGLQKAPSTQKDEDGISTAMIEENAPVLTKSMLTRLLDLEMRCKASDAKIEQLEQRWNKAKNLLEAIRPEFLKPWKKVGSDEVVKDPEKGVFQLNTNLYSVVATASWKSTTFWFALLIIVGFQFVLLCLLAFYQMDIFNTKTSRSVDNPLNLPPNVELPVRLAQVMILAIALFSQGDLLGGVENLSLGMPDCYRGAPRFHNVNLVQWRFASIIRVCQGLVYIICAFILSVQSETIFDVLLNVLGVGFVSDLDDLVFRLGMLGYFGRPMKMATIEIDQCDFYRKKIDDRDKYIRNFKKGLHRIVTYFCLAVVLMFFFTRARDQDQGKYTVQNVYVEMNDESFPRLNSFSGMYMAKLDQLFNRRLIYSQVDSVGSERGRFMYCFEREDGRGAWVFVIENEALGVKVDPCRDFTLTSTRTITFDILSIEEWYFSLCEDKSADSVKIHEAYYECRPETIESNDKSLDGSRNEGCPILQGAGSLPLFKIENENTRQGHGIYMSKESTVTDGRELLFFTGSTWVMTTEEQLGFNGSDIVEFLDIGLDFELNGVNLITEPVSETGYWPNQETFYVPSQNESLVLAADKSRPVGTLECLRCESWDSSISCNTGRCNPETGTCDCLHNETGSFCENPPIANGICESIFNDAPGGFDNGDCCGATCKHPHCGKDGLTTLFGWDVQSLYYTDFSSTEDVVGFQKCRDENMTAVLLELVPLPSVRDLCVPTFTVTCGGGSVLYLRTPLFCRTDLNGLQQEKIMVPPGVTCRLSIGNADLTNGIDRIQLLHEGDSGTIVQVPVFDEVLEWSVP